MASLAPRPIILTEGGLDRDFNLVKRAYEISGHPENVETHHYQKYTAPETRNTAQNLPEGLGRASFYDSVNVDGPNHYFKNEFCTAMAGQSPGRITLKIRLKSRSFVSQRYCGFQSY